VVVELKAVDCLHSISLRAGLRRLHHPELFRRRASHD
jgi:hypothetical protein